jgi:YVTN family beta-propeller protein
MKHTQLPRRAQATDKTPGNRGRLRSRILAATTCLALAGITAWVPAASASASPFSRPAHASRNASLDKVPGFPRRALTGESLTHRSIQAGFRQPGQSGFGSALVGSVPVGKGPSELALNPATHTIYVANGNNDDGPNAGGNTVSVIDDRHCSAQDISRCKGPWPTITVGNLPSTIAIDQKTDTVYVTIGDNAVSVFNGATCNALDHSGCSQKPATVPVGLYPLGIYADPANHTVYIANSNGITGSGSTTVSMLDSATCNAAHLADCPTTPPPTVDVGADPVYVDGNQATHTVYVTTISITHRARNGWAVFDANTCNATVQSGCATIGRIVGDPIGPFAGEVDPANDTLYTANWDNTVSAFDLRHCWAGDLAGCATQKPGTVTPLPPTPFDHDIRVVVDARLHSVYVVFEKDDALVVVNTNVCNGAHLAACATLRPPTIHTGSHPEGTLLDSQTQTLYVANEVDNTVSVIDAARCNATITRGCRQPPPAITVPGPASPTADPAVATLYVPTGTDTVAMINTKACNAHHLDGCTPAPATVTVGAFPQAVAVNPQTHTVYIANLGPGNTGTVTVLDERTCNATTSSGCTNARTLQVPGGNAKAIAVNPVTDTLYVATAPHSGGGLGKPSTISVFNAATCNATNTSGCGQAPHSVTVGYGAGAMAVNTVTDTIYVANSAGHNLGLAGNTVSVLDGTTCNATNTTGCSKPPKTITLGPVFTSPVGVAIDPATDTIYVADLQNGEGPGTVSVINGSACNATTTTGCGQTLPTVTVGFGPSDLALDSANHTVVVTNIEDTSVSVINAATCNAANHTGCHQTPPTDAVGNYPTAIALDPAACTAYVTNFFDNTVSIIPATR